MFESRIESLRRFYARLTAARAGLDDPRTSEAFAVVPRERFLGPGPWQVPTAAGYLNTETDDPAVLYQDIVVGLLPEKTINNGEPSLHARCLAAAAPKQGDAVVHVGAGTGYYTAILAHLVGDTGAVYAYELEPELALRAAANLAPWGHVQVRAVSALQAPLPEADVIYVCAGATRVPAPWLDALKPGGRLVLPLTPTGRLGCMLLVTRRSADQYAARIFTPAFFVDCIGARDENESRLLVAALEHGPSDSVRSLRRNGKPDDTAWCAGEGWWLSTAEPA